MARAIAHQGSPSSRSSRHRTPSSQSSSLTPSCRSLAQESGLAFTLAMVSATMTSAFFLAVALFLLALVCLVIDPHYLQGSRLQAFQNVTKPSGAGALLFSGAVLDVVRLVLVDVLLVHRFFCSPGSYS